MVSYQLVPGKAGSSWTGGGVQTTPAPVLPPATLPSPLCTSHKIAEDLLNKFYESVLLYVIQLNRMLLPEPDHGMPQ